MSELVTTSATEGWRIRIEKPGQRLVHFYNDVSYPTEAEAIAAVGQAIRDDAKINRRTRLGIQWMRVETIKGQVDWVHDLSGLVT